MELSRGKIYYITFPHTFDPRYPNGKSKFVLVLQEGEYFKKYDTVEVLLVTTEKEDKVNDDYITNVDIPVGTTRMEKPSWVCCSQTYPIRKSLFELNGVWCAGKLTPEKMDEIDEALYNGLCMGLQNELQSEPVEELDEAVGQTNIINLKQKQ